MNIEKLFSVDNISILADVMEEKNLEEITMECDDEFRLTLKAKRPCPPPPMGGMPMMAAPASVASAPAQGNAPAAAPQISGNVVKSPIVGTFYAAASPDKPAFVTVGQQVKKGDVLMIIESMKLMNEVTATESGTIEEILVENGDLVEFGQPLFVIS